MSIGYACLNIGTPGTNIRGLMQKSATTDKLTEVTANNLAALEKMIDYNRKNNIRLFRISSDLIQFGSSPVNALPWWDIHAEAFQPHRREDTEAWHAGVVPSGAIHRPEFA